MKCPKCSYERQPADDAPDWQCPACKVAYAKVLQTESPVATPTKAFKYRNGTPAPFVQSDSEQDEDDSQERCWLASRGQKTVIYSIVLNFLLRAVERSHTLSDVVVDVLGICIAVYSLIGIVKICSGLGKNQNQKILFMVLSFFPLINLLALVHLSVKASRMLREAGWNVGLLGARP